MPSAEADFQKRFTEQQITNGWLDPSRTNTIKALNELARRMSPRDAYSFPSPIVVFAPATPQMGAFYPGPCFPRVTQLALIYLSPVLESELPSLVNLVVSHEFAHALLHGGSRLFARGGSTEDCEQVREFQADQLVIHWGFAHELRTKRWNCLKYSANKGLGRHSNRSV